MPLRKFRTLEEAARSLWLAPGDPRIWEAAVRRRVVVSGHEHAEAALRQGKGVLAIVAHARSLGLSVTVFTTGTLLTPSTAAALAALHPLSVEVSIYSAAAEVHDRITGVPGSHARSLAALRLLREHRVVILLKSPLMTLNSGEYRGIVALAESLGAGYAFDPMLLPRRDGDPAPVRLSLDREGLRRYFADPVLAREFAQPVKCLPQKGEELCGTGRRTCLISPYGDVFPCSVYPVPAGNVRERPFAETD